jgi:hypothetical protein
MVNLEDRRRARQSQPLTLDERQMLLSWANSEDRKLTRSTYCRGLLFRSLMMLTITHDPSIYDPASGIVRLEGVFNYFRDAGWHEVGLKVMQRVFNDLVRLKYLARDGDQYTLLRRTDAEYRAHFKRIRDIFEKSDNLDAFEHSDLGRWVDQWIGGRELRTNTHTR